MKTIKDIVIIYSRAGIKSLQVNRSLITAALCILVFLFTASLVGYWQLGRIGYDAFAKWNVSRKHADLLSKLDMVRIDVSKFNSELRKTFRSNDRVRAIFGIKAINNEERMVGIGGKEIATGLDLQLLRIDKQMEFELWNLKNTYSRVYGKLSLYEHTPLIVPVFGRISSRFGVRVHPVLEKSLFHKGIDIANTVGTYVYATADGKVKKVEYDNVSGKYIVINHGYGYSTMFAHLNDVFVRRGERVERFQPIATLGNTGRTTGPHLHYEVRIKNQAVNPENFFMPNDFVVD